MRQTAVISGGARGIGRCLVRRFCERGYKVFVLDIDEEELSHTVKVHLKKYSDENLLASKICDLRDVEDIHTAIEAAAQFLDGRIDVLVNNGMSLIGSRVLAIKLTWIYRRHSQSKVERQQDYARQGDDQSVASVRMSFRSAAILSSDQINRYIDTNLTAPFLVSQAILPYMKNEARAQDHNTSEAGPCIVHIGSFRAFQSDANQEGYASTKAGLLGLTHSMAASFKPLGIRVNLVAPGRIKVAHECKEGDEKGTQWSDLNEEKDVADHLANRAGRPKDIADAVEYLVNAGFVTAEDITIDGGATKTK